MAAPAQFLRVSLKAVKRALEVTGEMRNNQVVIPLTPRAIAARRKARKQEESQLSFMEKVPHA